MFQHLTELNTEKQHDQGLDFEQGGVARKEQEIAIARVGI